MILLAAVRQHPTLPRRHGRHLPGTKLRWLQSHKGAGALKLSPKFCCAWHAYILRGTEEGQALAHSELESPVGIRLHANPFVPRLRHPVERIASSGLQAAVGFSTLLPLVAPAEGYWRRW